MTHKLIKHTIVVNFWLLTLVAQAQPIASEESLLEAIKQGKSLKSILITLQNKLKCGTECGSCLPELKRLVRMHGKI